MEKDTLRSAASGGAAGLICGLFGGGGGLVLVPLFHRWLKLDLRRALACSAAVMLPLCALAAFVYQLRGSLDLFTALPYLIGGALGGLVGGLLLRRVKLTVLRRVFALFILFAGVRTAFCL